MRNGDIQPMEFMARREDWSNGISIYARKVTLGVEQHVVAPLTLVTHENGLYAEPMVKLSIHEAQQLMDELWQCGLRPTEGTGSAGSLAATERHLKDMQQIAFGVLKQKGMV